MYKNIKELILKLLKCEHFLHDGTGFCRWSEFIGASHQATIVESLEKRHDNIINGSTPYEVNTSYKTARGSVSVVNSRSVTSGPARSVTIIV